MKPSPAERTNTPTPVIVPSARGIAGNGSVGPWRGWDQRWFDAAPERDRLGPVFANSRATARYRTASNPLSGVSISAIRSSRTQASFTQAAMPSALPRPHGIIANRQTARRAQGVQTVDFHRPGVSHPRPAGPSRAEGTDTPAGKRSVRPSNRPARRCIRCAQAIVTCRQYVGPLALFDQCTQECSVNEMSQSLQNLQIGP